jgi:hypothetical protein
VLRVDTVILLTNDSIRQTRLNLVCDYHSVLVPLLKSHMQECLQNQVYEDAEKKSLAAEKDLMPIRTLTKDMDRGSQSVKRRNDFTEKPRIPRFLFLFLITGFLLLHAAIVILFVAGNRWC